MRIAGLRTSAYCALLLLAGGCGSAEPQPTCGGSSEPLTVASGDSDKLARGLALDATYAYWTTGRDIADGVPSGGSLMRVALAGGAPEVLVSDLALPGALAVDAHNVYWIDDFEDRLMRVPLAGGAPVAVTSTRQAQGLAIDATSAYWLDFDSTTRTSAVMKAPLDGGAGVALAGARPSQGSLAVDPTSVYWTELDTPGGTAFLEKVSIDGGSVTTLISTPAFSSSAGAIAVDGTSVYFAGVTPDSDDGLLKVATSGSAPTTIAHTENVVAALAVDASHVYFSELDRGSVKQVPLGGGTVTSFSAASSLVSSIATNGAKACWASNFTTWTVTCIDTCR